jgi:hypothetical protein
MYFALVPKLLFGNNLLRNSVSRLQHARNAKQEFHTVCVPKQEFGNKLEFIGGTGLWPALDGEDAGPTDSFNSLLHSAASRLFGPMIFHLRGNVLIFGPPLNRSSLIPP